MLLVNLEYDILALSEKGRSSQTAQAIKMSENRELWRRRFKADLFSTRVASIRSSSEKDYQYSIRL